MTICIPWRGSVVDSDVWRSRCVRKKKGEMKWQGISSGDDHQMFSPPSSIEYHFIFLYRCLGRGSGEQVAIHNVLVV
ncbi:hypothetical protein BRADI_2g30467v3 [Brachypodium distachyon]|uniref:Uncharacterized protein n=1 Tax=Brachypodium distachyon TaxID=15368 RepID=A0A0Q3J287_BRADI|nr:hypothetical protein BRADI_2g30467v3 [Brachypodium distachyon]